MAGLWQNANQVADPVLESHSGVAKIGFASCSQQIAGQHLPLFATANRRAPPPDRKGLKRDFL